MNGQRFFESIATGAEFDRVHPAVAGFLKQYLGHEKAVEFGGREVINTHFPPYPSRAFEQLLKRFGQMGRNRQDEDQGAKHPIYSVTLGVTNRCGYNCWHCYNAGRNQEDVPLGVLKSVAEQLQDLGVARVAISGGEPLLREDLSEIVRSFDDRTCLTVNTTGAGLTLDRAKALRDAGVFGVGISLDSTNAAEHDQMRGKRGAFETALRGLEMTAQAGMYPFIISVASRDLLQPEGFWPFMEFAKQIGALEVHMIEPCATGKLQGHSEAVLGEAEHRQVMEYQRAVAKREDLPILSTFAYLESADSFGCGAGHTYAYIDGSGEMCPCNLVPLSFGNVTKEPVAEILDRMGRYFAEARNGCVGKILSRHIPAQSALPLKREETEAICAAHLPKRHGVPRFVEVLRAATGRVGSEELRSAYDAIHGHYEEFWVSEAGGPVRQLVGRLGLTGRERIFEAGCGTGYGTALLAKGMRNGGALTAADLSEGMLQEAKKRLHVDGTGKVQFLHGDALGLLEQQSEIEPFDLVFSSWVLGYIPLRPFFRAVKKALRPGGELAFVVHRENSPREALEIYRELVAEDPSVLLKQVDFDFPKGAEQVRGEMELMGFRIEHLEENQIVFRYDSPGSVLEHLLKSGAGTAFHEAIDPVRRGEMEQEFVRRQEERHVSRYGGRGEPYSVVHDYVMCIAVRG